MRAGEAVVAPEADAEEALFWTVMRQFETQALAHYRRHAPALASVEKIRFVATLAEVAPDDRLVAESALGRPIEALLTSARCADEASTLVVHGLVLERLRQAIYGIVARAESLSPESRVRVRLGRLTAESLAAQAARRIAERVGTDETLYAVFAETSHDVLGALDGIGDPVDRIFGARLGLSFADVMGEFAADLIAACVELGMQRRKVVAHLAGACMGI